MCAIIGFASKTLTADEVRPYFDRTVSRGPDATRLEAVGSASCLGFHRLAIMGLHEEGMQPFYLGGDAALACSAETQTKIDTRVVELVKAQHEKATRILTENREKLDALAKHLYEKETITGEEFMQILHSFG